MLKRQTLFQFFTAMFLGTASFLTFWNGEDKPHASSARLGQTDKQTVSYLELQDVLMLVNKSNQENFFIDIRPYEEYKVLHIASAIPAFTSSCSCELSSFASQKINDKEFLIIYGIRDQDINSFMSKISPEFIPKIRFYPAGLNEWKACGLPLERGEYNE